MKFESLRFLFVSCAFLAVAVSPSSISAAVQVFTFTGNPQSFVVPDGVDSVDVLAIGGGGGGANGHQGGGGAGYIEYGSFAVTPGDVISVIIGAGGSGADQSPKNPILGSSIGGATTFGSFLTANGGGIVTDVNQGGHDGSSGGGGAGNAGSPGGNGGSAGSNGFEATGNSMPVGLGMGTSAFAAALASISEASLSAGAGGAGGTHSAAGGGGAGGILVNGVGPTAGSGLAAASGQGGVGYGAGGGAGGYNNPPDIRFGGGDGAPGVLLVQVVPEPKAYSALLGLAALCAVALRRRRRS